MVRLKLKVGHKGQIIIPKILRKKYGIKENEYVIIEVRENELAIKSAESPEESLKWLKERWAKLSGKKAKLGELAEVDLEEEFENEDAY